MLLHNDHGKRYFVTMSQKDFGMLYFLRYLKLPGHFECKMQVYELLAIYKSDNPLINERGFFPDDGDDQEYRKYSRWLQLNRPSLVTAKSVPSSLDTTCTSERCSLQPTETTIEAVEADRFSLQTILPETQAQYFSSTIKPELPG